MKALSDVLELAQRNGVGIGHFQHRRFGRRCNR